VKPVGYVFCRDYFDKTSVSLQRRRAPHRAVEYFFHVLYKKSVMMIHNIFFDTVHLIALGLIIGIVGAFGDLFTTIKEKYIVNKTGEIVADILYIVLLFVLLFTVFYLYSGSLDSSKFTQLVRQTDILKK
jgi:nitrate/nitrite transporter NarK